MVRAGLIAAVLVSLVLLPLEARADRTVDSVTLDGSSSVTVAPGASISAVVNVTTSGSGANTRWRSTGWLIATSPPGALTCVDHANYDANGTFSETFSITAPATAGTYNAYFIAYNNDTCSAGASTTYTLASGVIVAASPAPPTVTTDAASGVTSDAATLNGTVSSNGAATTVTFQYGLTTAYGVTIAAAPSPLGAGAVNTTVSATENELNCNTVFHYRVVASNSAGTTNGLDGTFTTGACVAPYPATACAATRFGTDLGCTANDVSLTNIVLAATTTRTSCVSGTPVVLDLDLTVNFASPDRYDVGIFIANDGKLPTLLSANGGSSSCSVDVLPITAPPFGYTFPDLDGAPQGTADTCGDGNNAINGGTGSGVKRMTGVTLPCYATPASGGKLFVPFAVSWSNQKSPIGSLCTSNLYPVPGTPSKCNAPASSVSINVLVLPVITKTNGGSTINPGASTTYTVTVTNNSGGTLLDSVFTDPAVTDPLTPLTVNGVSCAAAGGATCPAMTSAAMISAMQGAGITIPSASLPNDGSLSFTINATLSSAATVGRQLINTATVTVSGSSASATDTDDIVLAPSAAMSFAPGTITEGASSVLTITLANPTASPVTAVAFTDTYPSGLVNTASASGATTCGGTVTAANGGNSVALSGGTIPASGNCTVTVNVTSAIAGSYGNSTGTVTSAGGDIPAASATLTVNVAVFGAFNACDVAAAPNASCTNTTTVTDSRITTKIAGSFSLDLVALKTDGSRNTSYNSTVMVELLDASDNSGALDSYNCRSSWTTVIATLSPNPAFSPSDDGLISVGPVTVPEAYRDVRVRVTNVGGSTKIGCSTDNFAIRPNTLVVSATDADWTTAGTSRTIDNTGATSPGNQTSIPNPIHKAGRVFTVTATAKNASSATTTYYAGTPALALSDCSPAGAACSASLGTFVLGTAATFASGVLTSSAATYSEVGAFALTLQDTDFAAVDSADTAANCTTGRYVCGTTLVGRFVPDHFETAVTGPMSCGALPFTPACAAGGLVYSGQPFTTKVTAYAFGGSGASGITTNYAGSFARDVALTAWDTAGGATENPPAGGGALSVNAVTAASFTAGEATTATPVYTFTATPAVPTNIYLRAIDADLVSSLNATTPSSSVEDGVKVVSGRLRLVNAYGSERLPLVVPAEVQYYDGTNWLTNTQDGSSTATWTLTPSGSNALDGANAAGSTSAVLATPLVSGATTLTASAPGAGGFGYKDLTINAPDYLWFAWAGGSPSAPKSRVSFGIYRGNNRIIYRRERY